MGHKFAVPVQAEGCVGAGRALGLLCGGDVNRLDRDVPVAADGFQEGNVFGGEGALAGVVQGKAGLGNLCRRLFQARREARKFRLSLKRERHQPEIGFGGVHGLKSFVFQVFGVREKPKLLFRGQDGQAALALRFGVPDTFFQKQVGIAVPFELAGHPEAVDIQVAVRLNGRPGVFGGNILDKAFAAHVAF